MKASKLPTPLAFETNWVAIPIAGKPNRILELMAKYLLVFEGEGDAHRIDLNKYHGVDPVPLRFRHYSASTATPPFSKEFGWELRAAPEAPTFEQLNEQSYLDTLLYRSPVFRKLSNKLRYIHAAEVCSYRIPGEILNIIRYSNCVPFAQPDAILLQDFLSNGCTSLRDDRQPTIRFQVKKVWYDAKPNWYESYWHSAGWKINPISYSEAVLAQT